MIAVDKIKKFLSHVINISIGYNEIIFFKADTLEEEQLGYSFDPHGISLITRQNGSWQNGWIAIANDKMGDPFIVDTNSNTLNVLSAAHGEGAWKPFTVADSLEKLQEIISLIAKVSKNRSNPVDLEKNPISDEERADVLNQIEKQNPNSEIWYWETYLEN